VAILTGPPPPVLASVRVLEYAVLDDSVGHSGQSRAFADGRGVGRVSRLAVGEATGTGEALLFHCTEDWSILATGRYASPALARARAERTYPGVSRLWVSPKAAESEAAAPPGTAAGEFRCSFCGRGPDQARNLIAQGDSRICNLCVAEFTRRIAGEPETG
jgi:ClpX C4-type zinc finger